MEIIKDAKIDRISITRAVPGMILARDVYTRSNQVVLNAGAKLDARSISRIMFYSVDSIFVFREDSLESIPESISDRVRNSVQFKEFVKNYDNAVDEVRETMELIIAGKTEFNQDKLIDRIENLILGCGSKNGIFNMLHCIRNYDEVTYMHCVNVALISNCFGKWLKLNEDEIRTLTLAGLLHDIGKICIPKDILLKPGSLTQAEYEIVKTHTLRGYDSLRDKKVDDRIKLVALQHHERADGSGYPYGKTADEVDPFAMIVSIADVYDAMTSDRVYRPKICPFDVIKTFEDDGMAKYGPRFLFPLLENITNVYINHAVKLSDGTVGKVVLMNNHDLSRPVVQVDDIFVDLSKNKDVKIQEMV